MKLCLQKIIGKASLTFEELRTMIYEIEGTLNSRPLTYVDEDFDDNILTPNHLIYGCNIDEKCFNDSSSADMNKTNAQNSFQHMKLVLQKFFNRFEKEYILVLKERHIYDKKRNSNYNNDLINDVVLIKEDITPRMNWRKAEVVNVIRGLNNLIKGPQLKVFQPKLNRAVQLIDHCN